MRRNHFERITAARELSRWEVARRLTSGDLAKSGDYDSPEAALKDFKKGRSGGGVSMRSGRR